MRVIAAATTWGLNGVSVFYTHLARELLRRGHDAQILITYPGHDIAPRAALPEDIPVHELPVARSAGRKEHWLAVKRWLEERQPCVFLPDSDPYALPGELSEAVRVVGIVHNDYREHYEQLWPMMAQWDAIVTVGPGIAGIIGQEHPEWAARLCNIPHGIAPPESAAHRPRQGPLRVVYAGRLEQEQKRVLDVLAAAAAARRLGADLSLTIAGEGTHRRVMEAIAARLPLPVDFTGTLKHRETLALFARSHVSLLTSDYEGFALTVAEAMAAGCVPVASRIEGGFRELLRDGETGLLVPPRDVTSFAQALVRLDRDRAFLAALSARAAALAADPAYSVVRMVDRYISLFVRVMSHAPLRTGAW